MYTSLHSDTIEHYDRARAKRSTGADNSKFEIITRRTIAVDGHNIKYVAKASAMADCVIRTKSGKHIKIEIKTCCGETGYGENPLSKFDNMDYILYTPELPDDDTINHDGIKCLESCYIFTLETFTAMLDYIHKKPGLHLKQNSNGKWNIQTLATYSKTTGKWSTVPLDKFYQFVEINNTPMASLAWVESIRNS